MQPARVDRRQNPNAGPVDRYGAARLIGVLVAWCVLGLAGAACADMSTHVIAGTTEQLAAGRWALGWAPISPILRKTSAIAGFASVVVPLSLWSGRRIGAGNVVAGLGDYRIRRQRFVAALAIVLIASLLVFVMLVAEVPGFARFLTTRAQEDTSGIRTLPLEAVAIYCIMITIVAPVSEEILFRGWLWTGLRRHLEPLPTGLITASLFVAAHLSVNAYKPLVVMPVAVLLSVARHYGSSVRASLALHMLNNGLAALMVAVSRFG
jgi:membrane protease YdiL (CAAX protease family)